MKRTIVWFVYFLGHWDRSKLEFVTIKGVITTWLWPLDDKSVVISGRRVNDEVFDDFNRGCYTTRETYRATLIAPLMQCMELTSRDVSLDPYVMCYDSGMWRHTVCYVCFIMTVSWRGRNIFDASDVIVLAVKVVNSLMKQGGKKSRRLVVWEHNISA